MRLAIRITTATLVLAGAAVAGAAPAGAAGAHDPRGSLEGVSFGDKYGPYVSVSGWAFDPDVRDGGAGQRVHLYLDGRPAASIGTGGARADVERAYPGFGARSGFTTQVLVRLRGHHTLCAYAINRGAGATVRLGCRAFTSTASVPVGRIESVTTLAPDRLAVAGWALDPVGRNPVQALIYVDDLLGGGGTALELRHDIWRAYPRTGPFHGFHATVDVGFAIPAGARICLNGDVGSNPLKKWPDTYCVTYAG